MTTLGWFEGLIMVVGLVAITLLTRGFFFLSRRPVPMPPWLMKGLRFAPLAAMAAVVAPQIALDEAGRLLSSWLDPRIWGSLAAVAWFFWRRGLLGTILAGTAAYVAVLLLHATFAP